jgi:hypothetical protein
VIRPAPAWAGSPARTIAPYLELEARSAGWVPGHPYLDRDVRIRLGAALSLR